MPVLSAEYTTRKTEADEMSLRAPPIMSLFNTFLKAGFFKKREIFNGIDLLNEGIAQFR
jgi:hypothetical protein